MAQEICTDAVVDSCNVLDIVYDSPQKDIRNPWKFSADYGGHEKEQDFYAAHRMKLYPTLKGMNIHNRFLRVLPMGYSIDLDGRILAAYDWGLAQDLAEDEGYILCMAYWTFRSKNALKRRRRSK